MQHLVAFSCVRSYPCCHLALNEIHWNTLATSHDWTSISKNMNGYNEKNNALEKIRNCESIPLRIPGVCRGGWFFKENAPQNQPPQVRPSEKLYKIKPPGLRQGTTLQPILQNQLSQSQDTVITKSYALCRHGSAQLQNQPPWGLKQDTKSQSFNLGWKKLTIL